VVFAFTDEGKGADHTFGARSAPKAMEFSDEPGNDDDTDTTDLHGGSGPGLPSGNHSKPTGGNGGTPADEGPVYGPAPPPDHQLPRPSEKSLPVSHTVLAPPEVMDAIKAAEAKAEWEVLEAKIKTAVQLAELEWKNVQRDFEDALSRASVFAPTIVSWPLEEQIDFIDNWLPLAEAVAESMKDRRNMRDWVKSPWEFPGSESDLFFSWGGYGDFWGVFWYEAFDWTRKPIFKFDERLQAQNQFFQELARGERQPHSQSFGEVSSIRIPLTEEDIVFREHLIEAADRVVDYVFVAIDIASLAIPAGKGAIVVVKSGLRQGIRVAATELIVIPIRNSADDAIELALRRGLSSLDEVGTVRGLGRLNSQGFEPAFYRKTLHFRNLDRSHAFTTKFGQIHIPIEGSEALRVHNYFHELVHSILTPDEQALFGKFWANVRWELWDRSHLLRYSEEVLAEMNGFAWSQPFRQGRVWENATTWQHFRFANRRAFKYYDVTRLGLFTEAAAAGTIAIGPGVTVYYFTAESGETFYVRLIEG